MTWKIHMLADRVGQNVRTLCGVSGIDDGIHEFTTLDGYETRREYADNERAVTCKSCLTALAAVKRRGSDA